MQPFRVTAPLEIVAVDILCQLFAMKRGKQLLLVITDRLLKLEKIFRFANISAGTKVKAFMDK